MKKIYLHIGTHKTGSTAVQAFAARCENRLRGLGLLYPAAARPRVKRFAPGHHLLPWTQLEHVNWKQAWGDASENPSRVWDDLRGEIERSACQKVLISSEEFDVLDDDGVAFVSRQLAGFDVEVICYLRRLDEFVQSYYTTDVLYHGETRKIGEYLEGMRTTTDYLELVERWRRPFGNDRVRVAFYTRGGLERGDIVADVFAKTGVEIDAAGNAVRSHFVDWGAPSAASIEHIRRMNVRGTPVPVIRATVLAARLLSRRRGKPRSALLGEAARNKLVDYGLERARLLNSEAFTPEVEAEFSKLS